VPLWRCSSGFDVAVAISLQFKKTYGPDVRVLTSGNDTGRPSRAKTNLAVIAQMGISTYVAQEGVFEFGSKAWGPAGAADHGRDRRKARAAALQKAGMDPVFE
jgi:hypothetical protein